MSLGISDQLKGSQITEAAPRVSVGLPVHNGENYLEEAIASILAQTFGDFELIISDNASSDRTPEICQTFAQQDNRIRYVRSAENLGGAANFNRVFALARGEYFKWAAHDDLIAPTFLERCVATLDANPEAVIAYAWTQIIDAKGHPGQPYAYNSVLATDSPDRVARFRSLIHPSHQCYQLFGLMRANILRQTPLHGPYFHGDGVLLARLALWGPFCELPEPLFLARSHPEQTLYRFIWSQKRPDYYALTLWCDPSQAQRLITPKWTILREYWRAIAETPLSTPERRACYRETWKWARTYWKGLLRDLGYAMVYRWKFRTRGSGPVSVPSPV